MRPTIIALCLSAALTGGCSTLSRPPVVDTIALEMPEASTGWRSIARPEDQQRIDAIDARFQAALADLPRRLKPREAADKQLLDPHAAQPLPALTPGGYQCRRIRLGGRAKLTRFKADTCYVSLEEGDRLSYTTQTGAMTPGGWLYPDGDRRVVLLATDRPAAAKIAPAYGIDARRDLAGVVERLGPMRWRLTISRANELDIWELKPWPQQQLED
ncbi:MAG TPA: DUF4893 domain-containing protein [Sphingomonas sp.]|nr:DUF4893 domain-containing protein [Sphingomonas sp.]